jgi:hypothetical protein
MRTTTTIKTHVRKGLSPGQTFKIWIDNNHSDLNVRKVAKEFVEWVNSDGREFDAPDEIKMIFLELTRLTVDHARKQRRIRSYGFRKCHTAGLPYVEKINLIVNRIREHYPAGPQLRDFAGPDGRIVFVDRPIVSPPSDLSRFSEVHEANYVLKQYRLLTDEGAFADFRRCALKTCDKYFFPLRPERRYCSDVCQAKHYMQNPLRGKKNAADQKVYYYTKKVLDLARPAASSAAHRMDYEQAQKMLELAKREQTHLASKRRRQ